MRTLQPLEKPEWLLAFDFDGTLFTPDSQPPVPSDFFKIIKEVRENQQCLWGINTGRSLMQTVQGINEARFPFLPDYIIAREREIYTPNKFGRWLPVKAWNKGCDKDHKRLFRKNRRLMKQMRQWIEQETSATWGEQEGEPAGVIASSAEEMNRITQWLNQQLENTPLLGFQRNAIYLRFSHQNYHKGSALAEVGKLTGITPEKTFAIGDGHNDLDMMDVNIASHLACPGNACPEIKERISEVGGYIAQGLAGDGAIEALLHLFAKLDIPINSSGS